MSERYPKAPDVRFEQAFKDLQARLVQEAEQYIGFPTIRYRTPEQGMSPSEGFDCSGFITFLLDSLALPREATIRHADEYFARFGDFVHEGRQRAGDLVFFSANGIFPTHVGLMKDTQQYIHAPGKDGEHVRIDSVVRAEIPIQQAYSDKQIIS